jgi:hypothetical protein
MGYAGILLYKLDLGKKIIDKVNISYSDSEKKLYSFEQDKKFVNLSLNKVNNTSFAVSLSKYINKSNKEDILEQYLGIKDTVSKNIQEQEFELSNLHNLKAVNFVS